MVVAVEYQLCALRFQHVAQRGGVDQRLAWAGQPGQRRVVDHHHARITALAEVRKKMGERLQLGAAQLARGPVEGLRRGRRDADKGDVAAEPHIGEGCCDLRRVLGEGHAHVALHVGREVKQAMLPRHAHVAIMVSWHEADPVWRAEGVHPARCRHEFLARRDVHDVAGQRHMVWCLAHDVGSDGQGHGGVVHAVTTEPPVHDAYRSFQGKVPVRRSGGQWAKVKVGKMGEGEHVSWQTSG